MKNAAYDISITFLGLCLLLAGIWTTTRSPGIALSVIGGLLVFIQVFFSALHILTNKDPK